MGGLSGDKRLKVDASMRKTHGAFPEGPAAGWWGLLLAASVGRALSPPVSVVVLLKSDFLAYYY
jgi:hypothetical protein